MPDVTPVVPGRSAKADQKHGAEQSSADAAAKRRADDAADASLLRDRVIAAFGEQYLIEQEVGRGGMAVVYAAEDVRLQRRVALKVLPPDLAFRSDVRERFTREAQTAARLNHPNIVPIYAVHEQSGVVCFAMALVTGESVAAWVARETHPSFEAVANVLEQVADALAYAHASGVVHRDIKPDNILLDRESGRAMVTDFGIARAAETGTRLTQTGIAVGTPAFMSPEQATGEKEVDGRSDVYSLGVVGYLMVAGRLPFVATSTPAMLLAHVGEAPAPIWSSRPDVPRVLVEILEKCLAKKPADRFGSAMTLRDALRRAQRDGSLRAAPPPHRAGERVASREAAPGATAGTYRNASAQSDFAQGDLAQSDFAHGDFAQRDLAPRDPAQRLGHRAEDWNPRALSAPELAPRHRVAPIPSLPPLAADASREEYREWRRAVREQRRDAQDRWSLAREDRRDAVEMGEGAGLTIDEQVARFRWAAMSTVGTMGFLLFINVATSRHFPWSVFPIFGMSMGLLAKWGRLRRRGARWGQLFGTAESATRNESSGSEGPQGSKSQRISAAVRTFRTRVKWLAGSAVAAAGSFMIGAGLNFDPMVVPFVGSLLVGVASMQLSIVAGLRVRRLGVPLASALGSNWKQLALVPDERPREIRMQEELDRIAGSSLMSSSFGATVRSAVDDRVTIREASARLTDADRALVPDVEPTADALLERITALASGLERLQRDLPTDALTQLEQRLAGVESEPETAPDRERRLALLTRQRDSLRELVGRSETMQRQLESASFAMRSLRLDMVKLRTMGVGAAINDVTNATQEARALSRDIGHAVDAADELRRL